MKLLIVDDEELTRNGIISSLNWEEIGITEIYQANDGINGLAAALKYQPDIILCDVRMPRMTGITMLERIEAQLPDITSIFMSGYSDKEYLKAAIQLKAVNYIEKPIDIKELESTIRKAMEQCEQRIRQRNAETVHTNVAATRLAFQLTVPYPSCKEAVDELCTQFRERYGTDKFKSITTFIVKLEHAPESPDVIPYLYQMIKEYLAPMHLHVIYSEKRLNHIVFHIYGSLSPSGNTLARIAEKLGALFAPSSHQNYYIAIGETVSGITRAYHSYESAVILLQSSFFFAPATILTFERIRECVPADLERLIALSKDYIRALEDKKKEAAIFSLASMNDLCTQASGLMPNQVKTVYYDLFSALYFNRRSQKLMLDLSIENHENIMDIMDSCFSFSMLHDILVQKNSAFFADVENNKPENSLIYLIRDYINTHYTEPGLSVKDISDYAHLSTSYACTYFKNETGTTLSQYITEFRMEKAKQLLSDPRYRINDIASSVGYNDSNYFGKSFRKYTGLSPSEYREKVLG